MTQADRTRYLGGLAACVLAASAFAPVISVHPGAHSRSFDAEVQLFYVVLALCSGVASLRGAFWVAALLGALSFSNTLLLLALTYRGLIDAQMQSWARPGWAFISLLASGAALMTLPARRRRELRARSGGSA
jgi:hypothetical protein